jgi:hypothetical protein
MQAAVALVRTILDSVVAITISKGADAVGTRTYLPPRDQRKA